MRSIIAITLLTTLAGCQGGVVGSASRENSGAALGGSGSAIVGLAGKCLDDNGDGTADGNKIQLWDCNGTDAQNWTYRDGQLVGPGGKCLDVQWNNQANGTIVQLYSCNGTDAQKWTMTNNTIVSAGGYCLDATGFGTANGTQLEIWGCTGGDNQRWTASGQGGGGGGPPTGAFHVANGQIIGPDGNPFDGRGLNLYDSQMSSACSSSDCSPLLRLFPKLSVVRLACFSYQDPSAYQSFIDTLTSRGVVVELEDHSNNGGNAGGSAGTVFSGQQLTDELHWFSAIASAYAGNPYVWFGTDNEPSENPSAAALSTWQQQTYQAIRNTGNQSIILVEMNCDRDPSSCAAGYTRSVYSNMTNIVWDMHYYGWLTGFATDQNTINNDIAGHAAAAQQLTSADGTVPIFIGEYGNSTDGNNLDANGMQVVAGVEASGFSSTAWHFDSYAAQDNLTDGSNLTSPFGTSVAAFIAAGRGPVR